MRFKFQVSQIHFFALIALSAILSGAFSLAFFDSSVRSAAMVYCPLTKTLQPVNPPPSVARAFSLNEICAADSEKLRLTAAIAENLKLKFINYSADNFEDLAFDFWQKGKSAFDSSPNLPNSPQEFAVKNSFASIGYGDNFSFKIVWTATEKFAFQTQPRPPTALDFPDFNRKDALNLKSISRRIAPRAPPVLV